MRERFCRTSVVWLILITLAALTSAQDWKGRGRVQGKVLDPDRNPLEGVKITLLRRGEEGLGPEPFYTNKKGRWAYTGLAGGDWTVVIEAEGYRVSEGNLKVIEYGGGPGEPLEVVMVQDEAAIREARGNELMGVLDQGNRLLQNGEFASARVKYEEVLSEIEDEKQQLPVLQGIAQTYLGEGSFAEARSRFEALLLQLEPTEQPAVLRNISRTHYEEGNIDPAIEALQRALAADPEDIESLRLIINVLVAEGREKEAEPYMSRLPEGEKIDANALLNLGVTEYNNGNLDPALEHFNKVVAEYPDNADAYYYRGLTLLGKAENAGALADFEKMLQLAPDHANAAEAEQFLEYLKSL